MLVKMPIPRLKKLEKDGTSEDICKDAEEEVQNLTNSFIRKSRRTTGFKEAEIMKVLFFILKSNPFC
jgi:ribosome recycling factor